MMLAAIRCDTYCATAVLRGLRYAESICQAHGQSIDRDAAAVLAFMTKRFGLAGIARKPKCS